MKKIVIVNGAPGSGKTTFETMARSIIEEKYTKFHKCYLFSTIDFVKEIARMCGWDGKKDGESRKFLSDLKDLLTEWNDVPTKDVTKKVVDALDNSVIFIDCREPSEIKKLCFKFCATSLLIRRKDNNTEITNHADAEVENYNYDIIIENNGTRGELWDKAYEFLNNL